MCIHCKSHICKSLWIKASAKWLNVNVNASLSLSRSLPLPMMSCISHITAVTWRGAWRHLLPLRVTDRNGNRHPGGPLPGARRVWRQPVRNPDGVHPSGGGDGPNLHTGRQPSGVCVCVCLGVFGAVDLHWPLAICVRKQKDSLPWALLIVLFFFFMTSLRVE